MNSSQQYFLKRASELLKNKEDKNEKIETIKKYFERIGSSHNLDECYDRLETAFFRAGESIKNKNKKNSKKQDYLDYGYNFGSLFGVLGALHYGHQITNKEYEALQQVIILEYRGGVEE